VLRFGFTSRARAERYANEVGERGAVAEMLDSFTGELILKTGERLPFTFIPVTTYQVAGGRPGTIPGIGSFTAGVADFPAEWVAPDGRIVLGGFVRFSGAQPGGGGIPVPSASPPASPVDGTLWVFPADAANGINWLFQFNSAEATFKWEFLGGQPTYAVIGEGNLTTPPLESCVSGTYVDIATVGPSLTVPRAGDYVIDFGCMVDATDQGWMAIKLGAAATADPEGVLNRNVQFDNVMRRMKRTGLTASEVLKAQYRVNTGTARFMDRWLTILPTRVI
jgi:hypothetical protein